MAPPHSGGLLRARRVKIRLTWATTLALLVAVLSAAPPSADAQQLPEIGTKEIRFPASERVLPFSPITVIHEDPLVALDKGEPVEVTREARLLPNWKRVVVLETRHYYEGATVSPILYDYRGNKIFAHRAFRGPIYFAPNRKRFFACELSAHYRTEASFVVSEEGEVLATIPHRRGLYSGLYECSPTEDGRLMVRQYPALRPGGFTNFFEGWYTIVQILDFSGREVGLLEVDKGSLVEFRHKGTLYKIPVEEPQPSG